MEIQIEGYGIDRAAHYKRAVRNLEKAETEKLADYFIYSALEFRNCIERVLFEYLYLMGHNAWNAKWEKEYRATRLKDMIIEIEPEFAEKIQFANLLLKALGSPPIFIIDLDAFSRMYGKLGNYLHAYKNSETTADCRQWWGSLDQLLYEAKQTLFKVFSSPMGFTSLNERGLKLYQTWREGKVTDEQVVNEYQRANFEQQK